MHINTLALSLTLQFLWNSVNTATTATATTATATTIATTTVAAATTNLCLSSYEHKVLTVNIIFTEQD